MLHVASHDPYTDLIPRCFERIVAAYPGNLAVGGTDWQPTFSELNVVANRVAHAILRSGAASGDRVAILMGHDAPLVATIMGVLKAGCVVGVLNTTDPPARLRQVVDDAEPAVVIVEARHIEMAQEATETATVLGFQDIARDAPSHNPALTIPADQHALIVYTSGSTGQPNGIMHVHGATVAQAQNTARMMEVSRTDRLLFLQSAGGAHGITTVIVGLLSGASLWPFPALEKGVYGLADYLTENAITVCTWSASIFRHMAITISPGRRFPTVRCVRLASERAIVEDFRTFERHFSEHCIFIHSLASSETGQIARLTLRAGDFVGDGALPVGHPHDGVVIELLDEVGRPVTHGEPGELVVTSRSVTVGYWRNPQLTAERCSVPSDKRHRTVRTRDLVRWNEAGVLEFVERLQRRYKIRGNRIELSEVERALRAVPGIKAVTCSVIDLRREPQLIAFIVHDRMSNEGSVLHPGTIRRRLRTLLPRQMIPSAFLFVDEIPVNANGKIDAGTLRELYETHERNHSDRPTTDAEAMIARIWGSALGLDDIGRQDDFFDLGGDSLTASVSAAWLQAEAGVEIDLGMFVKHPTVAMMAELVERIRSKAPEAPTSELAPASTRQEPAPLSFAQQFYWDTSQSAERAAQHTVTGYFALLGSLDRSVLEDALQLMYRRHEMLRTSFREVSGQVVQIVASATTLPLPFFDVSTNSDPTRDAQALVARESEHAFDLKEHAFIFRLVRLSEHEHWLTFSCHHIVIDGWSWRIFVRELAETYEAKLKGTEHALPSVRQFSDFARWQREQFQPDSPRYQRALIELIDEHLRGAYPRHDAYRKLLVWCIRRSNPERTTRNMLVGLLLRALFARSSPPAKLFPLCRSVPIAAVDPRQGLIAWSLPADATSRLDGIARGEGATHTAVLIAGCALLVSKVIGSSAVAIGSQFTNRHQPHTRGVFGFCANLMTFALDCDVNLDFRQFVRAVGDRIRRLQTQSVFPYDELQRMMRGWKIKPLRNVILMNAATASAPIRTMDLEIIYHEGYRFAPPAGIELRFMGANDRRENLLMFNPTLYDPASMRELAARLVRLYEHASHNPDLRLGELLAMSDDMAG